MEHPMAVVAAVLIGSIMIAVYIGNCFYSLSNIGKIPNRITSGNAVTSFAASLLMGGGMFILWELVHHVSYGFMPNLIASILGACTFVGFSRTVLLVGRERPMWGNYRAFGSVLAYATQAGLVVALMTFM